jgi:hypothetical protein
VPWSVAGGEIRYRPIEAADEPQPDRVGADHEDNRNCRCRPLGLPVARPSRSRPLVGEPDRRPTPAVDHLIIRPTIFDRHVLAFVIAVCLRPKAGGRLTPNDIQRVRYRERFARSKQYSASIGLDLQELYLAVDDIDHSGTKTKSPQTNGICERFHRTVLDEFYRIAFRKKIYHSIDELQADLDDRIRAAGASARPRCRPSLTKSHWRRRNSWPPEDRRQLHRLNQPTASVRPILDYYTLARSGHPRSPAWTAGLKIRHCQWVTGRLGSFSCFFSRLLSTCSLSLVIDARMLSPPSRNRPSSSASC